WVGYKGSTAGAGGQRRRVATDTVAPKAEGIGNQGFEKKAGEDFVQRTNVSRGRKTKVAGSRIL
ncbi:hypothetical protein COCVIDRAFT_108736, partial [Bipolaris victoriae FI3]